MHAAVCLCNMMCMVVPNSVPLPYIEVCFPKSTMIHETFPTVSTVVIPLNFLSNMQCLNYLSSMDSLSTSVKGSRLFLLRLPCSLLFFCF